MSRLPFHAVFYLTYFSSVNDNTFQFSGRALEAVNGFSSSDVATGDLLFLETDVIGDILRFRLLSIDSFDAMTNEVLFTAQYIDGSTIPFFNWFTSAIVSRSFSGVVVIPDSAYNQVSTTMQSALANMNDMQLATAGIDENSNVMLDEDLTSQIDGVTDTFTVSKGKFLQDSLQVIIGGLPQVQNTHFTEHLYQTGQFKTARPLDAEDGSLIVNYKY